MLPGQTPEAVPTARRRDHHAHAASPVGDEGRPMREAAPAGCRHRHGRTPRLIGDRGDALTGHRRLRRHRRGRVHVPPPSRCPRGGTDAREARLRPIAGLEERRRADRKPNQKAARRQGARRYPVPGLDPVGAAPADDLPHRLRPHVGSARMRVQLLVLLLTHHARAHGRRRTVRPKP